MRQFLSSVFSIALLPILLVGCQGLKTRNEVSGKKSPETQSTDRTATPLPTPPPLVTNQPEAEDDGAGALPPSAPQPETETFLSKELPKIGVILGPGGLKSYAHVGVLREFARARIPIHAIAGLEWGAMIAAFYAEKGLANDVDWKAFRMKDSDISSGGLLRGSHARSMSDFESYLSIVFPPGSFSNGTAERAKVPFGCPTVVKRSRLQFLSKGSAKDIVARCLPFPPLLAAGSYTAAPDAIEESAQWLRSQGANLIVLVNVLGGGDPLAGRDTDDHYATSVLWTEIRRRMLNVRAPMVNWIVSVNTAGKAINDVGARRANVELGARAAADLTKKLTKQYGF